MMTTWCAEGGAYADQLISFIKDYRIRYPLHRHVVFSNTNAEAQYLERRGVAAFFGHHNSLVDPRIYKVVEPQEKDLLAVYTAAMVPWKRHALGRHLASVGLIYWNYDRDVCSYFEELRQTMPRARFLNQELASTPHDVLSPDEVCAVLNRARVGLCLSAEEGGMHASVEYLLAGLPVVSTASKGGRDFFFQEDFVEIADATPEAVASAVDKVLARAPSAPEIRSRTIKRQQAQIDLFIKFLDDLVKAEGGSGYTKAQWDCCYCNKLIIRETLATFLTRIPMPSKRRHLKHGARRMLRKMKRFTHIAQNWSGDRRR